MFFIFIFILSCNLIKNNSFSNNKSFNSEISFNTNRSFSIESKLKFHKSVKQKKNLILSTVVRYSWDKIYPFIKSLANINNRNCDVVIFVSEVSQLVKDNLKSFGIIVYEISTKIKDSIYLFRHRWKLFSDFLEKNRKNYNIVLSVDLRDTIIQKNFFSLYENYSNFLGFSYESSTINRLIKKEFIIETFGEEIYKSIENKRNINCGTIWGTIDVFIEFSKIIYKTLLKYFTIDQTMLNYLIYYKKILNDTTIIFSDEYGQVLTLGLTERTKINLDSQQNILNFNNQVASIVHQYDRHPDIGRKIREKFCPELSYNKKIFYLFIINELFVIILIVKLINNIFYKKRNKNVPNLSFKK